MKKLKQITALIGVIALVGLCVYTGAGVDWQCGSD